MSAYILRRLLLMIPTILGIMIVSFVLIQFAPGGPVERIIAQLQGTEVSATARIGGSGSGDFATQAQMSGADSSINSKYRGAQGLDPEFIKSLEKQFGFDKPAHERLAKMIWDYARFDFGELFPGCERSQSHRGEAPGFHLAGPLDHAHHLSHLDPARYQESHPRRNTIRHMDERRDHYRLCGAGVPVRLFMIVCYLHAGSMSTSRRIDRDGRETCAVAPQGWKMLWHVILPAAWPANIAQFATTSLLTKNSFLDEIKKQYVMTARAKGLSENQVLYGHVFRNAMLIIIAGFPGPSSVPSSPVRFS